MDQKRALLQLKRITKTFSKGTVDEVNALNSVSLDVYPRDYVTIIGSNGAGKTTLLNIIAGVFPPDRGSEVIVNGTDITTLREYRVASFVGRVYQDPNIGTATKLTIEENLALALLRGKPRGLRLAIHRSRKEKFRRVLSLLGLGLEDRLTTLVGNLSSGQRQAVALVMATISNPSLLLLDEHVANLDPRTAQTVLDLTDMIVEREKTTTMMVTHNMEVALRYGNRLIMMHRGKIVVDMGKEDKKDLTISDLVSAFERAAGEQLADESILLRCSE